MMHILVRYLVRLLRLFVSILSVFAYRSRFNKLTFNDPELLLIKLIILIFFCELAIRQIGIFSTEGVIIGETIAPQTRSVLLKI